MEKFYHLDIPFETLGLLYFSGHREEIQTELLSNLTQLGINAEVFYRQHLKIFDKYMLAFKKHQVTNTNDAFFFAQYDSDFFSFYSDVILRNRSYLTTLEEETSHSIRIQLLKSIENIYGDDVTTLTIDHLDDFIQFLDQSNLNEKMKWKLMRFFQQPKEHLQHLAAAINQNAESCKKAIRMVEKPLAELLVHYAKALTHEPTFNIFNNLEKTPSRIYPTLIYPVAQITYGDNYFWGLLNHVALEKRNTQANSIASLLSKLKVLSDHSKFQILLSLKKSPKYNLEIAEELGLTAATTSHHMNALLTCNFVGLTKKHGRIYYHVEQEKIRRFIEHLQQLFL